MASTTKNGEPKLKALSAAPQPTTAPNFLYRTVVKVLVGPAEKGFDLHKELLCSVSDFFAAALDGGFREAEARVIKLPEQKVETFQYLVHWLYRRKLTGYFRASIGPSIDELNTVAKAKGSLYKSTELPTDLEAKNDSDNALVSAIFEDAPFHQLVSLYILADSLQIRGLKDHIVSLLVRIYGMKAKRSSQFWAIDRRLDTIPDPTLAINDAYERLPQTSPLRGLIVELYLDHMDSEVLTYNRDPSTTNLFTIPCTLSTNAGSKIAQWLCGRFHPRSASITNTMCNACSKHGILGALKLLSGKAVPNSCRRM